MKNKFGFLLTSVIILGVLTLIGLVTLTKASLTFDTATVDAAPIASQISTPATIHSQNEATLHFQTAGKVIYLPYKIGDSIYQGATIAQLDTYALQRQLTAALNTYQSTRDTFDQTQQNAQNGNLQNQQKLNLNTYTISPVNNTDVINDIVKRVLDQNQNTLDNSVINVELANYALQLASLTSPINGVITSEDITTPNVNITPLTSFSVADPTLPILKARVTQSDIDYVTQGAKVTIALSGSTKTLSGTVTQVEPQKISDSSGDYYIVDITSDSLKQYGKLGQAANVLISNTLSGQHLLIPRWVIVGHTSVWVVENNQPKLVKVAVGQTHGAYIEVLHGLSAGEKVISNPQTIAKLSYSIL